MLCVIFGGGGHASVLIESLKASNPELSLVIVDKNLERKGTTLGSVPYAGTDEVVPELVKNGARSFIVGIGSVDANHPRERLFKFGLSHGLNPLTVVSKSAIVSESAKLGAGIQLLPGCIINTNAKVDQNVIVNCGAIVEHDCHIEPHAHVATGATLCGGVFVGTRSHVGAGAVIKQGIRVGKDCVIGAGAVVLRDVGDNEVVVGVPAKLLRSNEKVGSR